MNIVLEKNSIMANSQLFNKIPEDDIVVILANADEGYEMSSVLNLIRYDFDIEYSDDEKLQYYNALVDLIISKSVTKYNDSDKAICVAYLMSIFLDDKKDIKMIFNLCKSVVEEYSNITENMSDEIWLFYEKIKYGILKGYRRADEKWKPEVILSLVESLRATKEKYEELVLIYDK